MTMSNETIYGVGSDAAAWRDCLAPVLALCGPLVLLAPGLAAEPLAGALAVAAMAALAHASADAARALRARGLEGVALSGFCLGLCLALYLPWLGARWSIIDDHELVLLLGGRSRLGLVEALRGFAGHYEVGGLLDNSLARFRPGYYLVRFANLWLFGDEVVWWNLFDFGLLCASLTLAAWTLRRFLGLAGAALAVVAFLSLPFWPGVLFSNLQQESVALLGASLCGHGLVRAFERERVGAWAEACLGAILAMAVKENFLVLALVPPVAAAFARRRGLLPGRALPWLAAVLIYAALAGAALGFLLSRQGEDMYANPVSASSRLSLVLPGLKLFASLAALDLAMPAIIPFLAFGAYLRRSGRYPGLARDAGRACLALTGLAGLFVSQYVFYSGQIPLGAHRYDFPAQLAAPGAWLTMAWFAAGCLGRSGLPHARLGGRALVLAVLATLAAANGFDVWRGQLRLAVEKTRSFEARIGALAVMAKAEPGRPILLTARNPDSIEAVDSVLVNLRLRFGVNNPIFLDYRGPEGLAPELRHLRNLDAELSRLSRDGSAWLAPLGGLAAAPKPFGLGLDGPARENTVNLGRIWPLP
jgi:hypothetical protein